MPQQGAHPGWGGYGPQFTVDQRETVSRLAVEYGDEVAPLYAKLNRKTTELYWAMNAEKPDRAKVLPLVSRCAGS